MSSAAQTFFLVVSGANRPDGIGFATAVRLADAQTHVVALQRAGDAPELAAALAAKGARLTVVGGVDLAGPAADVDAAHARALAHVERAAAARVACIVNAG